VNDPDPTAPPAAPPPATADVVPAPAEVVIPPPVTATPPLDPKRKPEQADVGIVPFHPTNTQELFRFAQFLAKSELIPKPLWGRPYDVLNILLRGRSLGIVDPMIAVGNINIIEGKAELSAALMVALIRKSGLCEKWQLLESTEDVATYEVQRKGEDPIRMSFTWAMAGKMGLASKSNWQKMPSIMLRRRCQSTAAREVFPEICMGLYDEGELSEMREVLDATDAGWRKTVAAVPIEIGAPEPPPALLPSKGGDPLKTRLQERKVSRDQRDDDGPLFNPEQDITDRDADPAWMAPKPNSPGSNKR
jgi:hypothetical protein